MPALIRSVSHSSGGGFSTGSVAGGDETVVTDNSKGKVETRYYYYETDVLAGVAGTKLKRYNRIQPFTYLPSQQVPVLAYLGPRSDGKRAIFLVSDGVIGQTGAGDCFPAPEDCQLLALAPGDTEDLVYGPDNTTYRVKVRSIRLTVSKKPPKG